MSVIHVNFHARRRVGGDVRLGMFDDSRDVARAVFMAENNKTKRVLIALLLPEGFDAEAVGLEPSEARTLAEALLAAAEDAES